jgi:hypothetical protein
MEGSCSTGQSPQWAVVPVEEEEVKLNSELIFSDIQHLFSLSLAGEIHSLSETTTALSSFLLYF